MPHYNLDDLFWHEDWVQTPMEPWRKINADLIAQEHWIIDGTYSSVLEPRLRRADLIIFLDLPTWFCLYRVVRRCVRNYFGWERSLPRRIQDAQPFLKRKVLSDWGFYYFVFSFKRRFHPIIHDLIDRLGVADKTVRLKSDREVTAFLKDNKMPIIKG